METKTVTLKDFFGKKKNQSGVEKLHEKETIGELKNKVTKECPAHEWRTVWKSILGHLDKLLDIEIVEVLMRPWKNFRELAKYTDTEKYPPDRTYLVHLLEHTITSTHQPEIVVELEPLFRHNIMFDITVELFLKGFTLEIQAAKIKKIYTGECKGSGKVECMQVTLLSKELDNISLPGVIDLGEGVPIGKS